MGSWQPTVFTRLAECAAQDSTPRALSSLRKALLELGFSSDEGPDPNRGINLDDDSGALLAPADLDVDCLAFVRHLALGLTKRVELEAKFAHSDERATMLSSASFEGILIHKNGVVIAVNDSLAELLGLPKEELLGPDTIPRCVAPHDIPTVADKMRSGYEGSYVIDGLRGDGTQFRAELQSKQGRLGDEPIRVAAVRDVTERERTLNLLQESEAQLRDLVDTVFDVTILSRDGRAIDVSESQRGVTGYERDEILGRHVWDFVAPETRAKTEEFVSKRRVGAYESILIAKNGERIPIEVVATNTTLGGQPVRLAGLRDLRRAKEQERQREQLRRQMERAQRLDSLGALAGGVAHDFNNLLVGILGTSELLKEDLAHTEHGEMAETIFEASLRAKELTGRLLAYSGKATLGKPEPIDLTQLFEQLDRLTHVTRPRDVKIALDLEKGCMVLGERASITQVMLNLVTNALEAIGTSPGSITVRGRRIERPDARWDEALGAQVGPGEYVQLEVVDTGAGMDPETTLRAFEPFFTTKAHGHGLGLAASLGIITAHRGAVHVRSELGVGTTFALLLPSAEAAPRHGVSDALSAPQPRSILIVDDETVVRQHVVRVLKRRGYEILQADGKSACLRHLKAKTPDLILMDMTMPEGSGAEIAALLRSHGVKTPIVLTSGYVPHAQRDEFSPDLFQGFLQKPYSITELTSAIDRALSS